MPATYVATQAALAAVAAPHATFLTERPADNVQAAAVASGLVLIGGLWVAIVGWLLLQDMEKPAEPFSEHLVTYAVVLATLIGVETFIAMTWVPGSHVWWVLLTTLVVLTPDPHYSTRRAIERAAGTVVGAIAASVLVMAIEDRRVILALGALAALATCAAFMAAPYWIYTSFLTFTLVALTLPSSKVLTGSAERIGYTIVAAVIAVVVTAILRRTFERHPGLP